MEDTGGGEAGTVKNKMRERREGAATIVTGEGGGNTYTRAKGGNE